MRLQEILRSPHAPVSDIADTKDQDHDQEHEQEQRTVLSAERPHPYPCAMRTILLIVLILLLIGVLPTWDYSSTWGYRPLGGVGVILLIIIVLAVMGKL
jgi:hypothetical protein